MSKKKVILSIILLLFLVLAGIVLPFIWMNENSRQNLQDKTKPTLNKAISETEEKTSLKFLNFEELQSFFSESIISDLKEQFSMYLDLPETTDITEVTFLPEKTFYSTKDETCFSFSLSDGSSLPVTYRSSTGAFLFGKEKQPVDTDAQTYDKAVDDSLPPITADSIEQQQEGGYDNTSENKEGTP